MAKNIELGKAYVKRSAVTGKARKVIAQGTIGKRVVCLCDDNGRTIIVNRWRLHADSGILVDVEPIAVSAELSAQLDKLLG